MSDTYTIRLTDFDLGQHGMLLEKWLRAPHVARWWGEPVGDPLIHFRADESAGESIILVDDVPVGYMRWRHPAREELRAAGLEDVPEDAVDIDIALGEERWLGTGVGPEALRQLVEQLRADGGAPMLIIGTSIYNHGAASAYEKAGFQCQRRFDDPEHGPMWLMAWSGATA
jgi:RimJ/RimL family protein N-acetyltransferase